MLCNGATRTYRMFKPSQSPQQPYKWLMDICSEPNTSDLESMNPNIQQLIEQTFPPGITFRAVRECGICGAPVGYRHKGDQLYFDGNCYCLTRLAPLKPRSWDELPSLPKINPKEDLPMLEAYDDILKKLIIRAIKAKGLDPEYYALDHLVVALKTIELDLTNIDTLLRYSKRGMVIDQIRAGNIQKAKQLCEEFAVDFSTIVQLSRDMRLKK